MKKLMKKGSLLIVWSLLLAMMFGMSVYATGEYSFAGRDWTLSVGDILDSGDKLVSNDENMPIQLYQKDDSGSYNYVGRSVLEENKQVYTVPAGMQFIVDDIQFQTHQIGADYGVYVSLYQPPVPTPDNNTNASNAPEAEEDKHKYNLEWEQTKAETEEDKHVHNWEWMQIQEATDAQDGVEVRCCTECGQQGESRTIANSAYGVFCGETKDKITGAAENATVEMETEMWSALPKSVMDAIKERRDLTVNLTLTYQNKEYPLSIPAGYDMSVLEEADWYGVLYLNLFFGVANQ